MKNKITVSIITPTRNRADLLDQHLNSLVGQLQPGDEQIIIVNNCTDQTLEICRSYQTKIPLKIIQTKQQGFAPLYNLGAKQAKGKYLVFLDDDCKVKPDYLRQIKQFCRKNPQVVGQGKSISLANDKLIARISQDHLDNWLSANTLSDGSLCTVDNKNLVIPKTIMRRLGGFSQVLPEGAEDTEFGQRLIDFGYKISFQPQIVAYHRERDTLGQFLRQHWRIAYSHALYDLRVKPKIRLGVFNQKIGWRRFITLRQSLRESDQPLKMLVYYLILGVMRLFGYLHGVVVHRPGLLVWSIFLLGTFFRFANFSHNLGWWGDSARDYLAAYHIVKFQDYPLVGPYATGFYEIQRYSTFYFYFLSLLVRVFESPFFVFGFFNLLHCLSILGFYEIGKAMLSPVVGLIAAFLFAISPRLISLAWGGNSAYSTFPIFIFGLAWFFSGLKHHQPLKIYLAYMVILLAGSCWYGYLLWLLFLFPLAIYKYWKQPGFLICLSILITGGFYLFNFSLFDEFSADKLVTSFLATPLAPNKEFFFNLLHQGKIFLGLYFEPRYQSIALIIIFLGLGFARLRWLAIWFILFLAMISLPQQNLVSVHYFLAIEWLIFIVLAIILVNLSKISKIVTIVALVLISWFMAGNFTPWQAKLDYFSDSRAVADLIATDYERLQPGLVIYDHNGPSGWENPTLWYFLEKKLDKQLIEAAKTAGNFKEIVVSPLKIALICKGENLSEEKERCITLQSELYSQWQTEQVRELDGRVNKFYLIYLTI